MPIRSRRDAIAALAGTAFLPVWPLAARADAAAVQVLGQALDERFLCGPQLLLGNRPGADDAS